MCRLFALSARPERVSATFWLLDAPDSVVLQSHHNADGTGLGWFDEAGRPHIDKQPLAAYDDLDFARDAKEVRSSTFVAHIRYATGTPHTMANTHPFEMDGRVFAHNGVVGDLGVLEAHLGEDMRRVAGDTDSERVFALITREAERADGDVTAGIERALNWLANEVEVYAVNLILATDEDLWAVRWPDTHDLFVLDRRHDDDALDQRSSHGTRVHSTELAAHASVVIASEKLDDSPAWRMLEPGELVHIGVDRELTSRIVVDRPPRRALKPH